MTYAFKKESKGERHGTPAERLLAAQMRAKQVGGGVCSASKKVHEQTGGMLCVEQGAAEGGLWRGVFMIA